MKKTSITLNVEHQKLVKSCLKSNRKAQKQLYETFKVQLFRVCLRYAKSRQEAEDLLQEGFIKIFNDLSQYNGKGALGAWMRKVVVNVALQHIRRRKDLFSGVEVEVVARQYPAYQDVYADLNAKALTEMIQKLPLGYQTVFNLFAIEGYSHKEIAAELGISVSTSKSQFFKARTALQKMLGRLAAA